MSTAKNRNKDSKRAHSEDLTMATVEIDGNNDDNLRVVSPVKKFRKSFKVSTKRQVNTKAFQIKGQSCEGNLLTFYFKKSLNCEKDEQPYVRELYRRILLDEELREKDLGISLIASRRGPDGEPLPPAQTMSQKGKFFCS